MVRFSVTNPNWPRYNHDNYNSTANSTEKILNSSNVATLTLQWFTPTAPGDVIQTQPIIRDGVVYTYSNGTILKAQRVQDGSVIWSTQLGQRTIGSTPLVSGDLIYATTDNDLSLHAVNIHTGQVVWSTVIDPVAAATGQGEVQGSLSQVENLVICPMDAGTAQDTSTNIIIRPTLNAFDALTGQKIWSVVIDPVNSPGIGVWSTPSYDTKLGLMFHGTSNANDPPAGPYSDALQARNYRTGELVWSQQYTANDVWSKKYPNGIGNPVYLQDRDIGASPNLFCYCKNGKKVDAVAVASKAGIMQAFRRKDGKRLWRTMLTETPSIAGNPGAAAAYDDNVFKGVLYQGFNSDPGPSLTTQLYLAVINGDLSLFPQFLQAIFVGTTGNISAVDACTGKILWSVGYPSPTFGAPTYANGLVYQAWLDGTIRIFNAKTGDVVSSFMSPYIDLGPPYDLFSTHYPISVSIPIVDGNLFISLGNDLGPIGGLMVYGLP